MIRFSDRDLVMRFRGGGVGHKSTRDATDFFKADRDPLDLKPSTPVSSELEDELEMKEAIRNSDGDMGIDSVEELNSEESESDRDDDELRVSDEWDEEAFGPEDDGAIDEDMVALGYSEL